MLGIVVKRIVLGFVLLSIPSCMSYYAKYQKFNSDFEQGNLKAADAVLASDKRGPKGKAHLLYFLNRGTVNSYLGNYEQSNSFFEEAYNISEIQTNNAVAAGLALLLNPKVEEYHGETFEVLLVNYYKALNYLKLGQYDEALVECKRMDIRLNKLTDKFSSEAKYKRDAFVHLLMGIIYDVNQDYNNAFIAYRNALNIYEKDYAVKFNTPVPYQLKQDLLRTAYLTGFLDDVDEYEKKFGMKYQPVQRKGKGEVILLWHNGFGPVKQEWSLDFTMVDLGNGYMNFVNTGAGLTIPVFIGNDHPQRGQLRDLQIVRMALPKYVERPPLYTNADLTTADGVAHPVELAENINDIAFKSLHDRFLRDLGEALLRLALKKAAELALRKENQEAGIALGLFNAISEQADTRNWQTLPYAIHYSRVPVDTGEQVLQFNRRGNNGASQTMPIPFNLK
ncbi:MAG: hypothetical protein JWO58_1968 [Chitinophagaceae bacterium]|nr:hypothetical protein [Chitinophagaceae bacterium]